MRTILRVVDGMVLPPAIESALKKLLNDYTVETYSQQPDNKKSTQARIDSIYKAFLFILEAYPPKRPDFTKQNIADLKKHAAAARDNCDLSSNSMKDLHPKLVAFTKEIVGTLALQWAWDKNSVKESMELLNEAEQYVLMAEGRADLATLTTLKTAEKTEYILQLDKALPPYNQQWIDELKFIKASGFPKTRLWFRSLPDYQKAYFCTWESSSFEPKDIMHDLNKFIGIWDHSKKHSLNFNQELVAIQNNILPIPGWFNQLNPRHQHMLRSLMSSHANNVNGIDGDLSSFKKMITTKVEDPESFKKDLNNLNKIPEWYWVLPVHQQYFLQHVLKNAVKIEDAVSFVSSRHRTLPVVSNRGVHIAYIVTQDGAIIKLSDERERFSHIASRDALAYPLEVRVRHAESNLAIVTGRAKPQQPILIQTLISPIKAMDMVPTRLMHMLPHLPPDLALWKLLEYIIANNPIADRTVHPNHPLNYAKYWYFTVKNDPSSMKLIKMAMECVKDKPGLEELIEEYKKVLGSGPGSATYYDYEGRELFLSSLEQLIILAMDGYSCGSCVSGKDRKAVELIHTDAMLIYKHVYGTWPKFGDPKEKEDRARFIKIFVDLYTSWHQHTHAGQNAPGSDGIKTPNVYLPSDIAQAIKARTGGDTLIDDDRRATDNEVGNIDKILKKVFRPKADDLSVQLKAEHLGEANCTRLYDALAPLIGESNLFIPKSRYKIFGSSVPQGIFDIKAVMGDPAHGKSNVIRMGLIFKIVLARPMEKGDRTDATSSVYDRMKDFFNDETTITEENLIIAAVTEWKTLFKNSLSGKAAAKAKTTPREEIVPPMIPSH